MISPLTRELTFDELLDLLEAQVERDCVQIGHFDKDQKWVVDLDGVCAEDQSQGRIDHLDQRGAAIVMPAKDWNRKKTELETACRELGASCKFNLK